MVNHEDVNDAIPEPPVWDGNLPEGKLCERKNHSDSEYTKSGPECSSLATIGVGYIWEYENTDHPNCDDDGYVLEGGYHYYCENCFSEFEQFDEKRKQFNDFITNIGKHIAEMNKNDNEKYPHCGEWPNCGAIESGFDLQLVVYGGLKLKDLAIKNLLDEAAWFSSVGRLDVSIEIQTYILEEIGFDEEAASNLHLETLVNFAWGKYKNVL